TAPPSLTLLHDLRLAFPRLEYAEVDRLPRDQRERRDQRVEGVVVVRSGCNRRIDLDRGRRAALLRCRGLSFHPPIGVGEMNIRRLTLCAPGLIDLLHPLTGGSAR